MTQTTKEQLQQEAEQLLGFGRKVLEIFQPVKSTYVLLRGGEKIRVVVARPPEHAIENGDIAAEVAMLAGKNNCDGALVLLDFLMVVRSTQELASLPPTLENEPDRQGFLVVIVVGKDIVSYQISQGYGPDDTKPVWGSIEVLENMEGLDRVRRSIAHAMECGMRLDQDWLETQALIDKETPSWITPEVIQATWTDQSEDLLLDFLAMMGHQVLRLSDS